jgi:ankyrin repeat protein
MPFSGTILHKACFYGNVQNFNDLVNSKISKSRNLNYFLSYINTCGTNRETPIYSAIRKNRIEIIRFLINNNADLTVKDKNGNTPLEFAIRYKFNDILLVFAQITNLINQNLIKLAQTYNNPEAITILMVNTSSETRQQIVGESKRDRLLAKLKNYHKNSL